MKRLLLITLILSLAFASGAWAQTQTQTQTMKIGWDAVQHDSLAGYRLYSRTESGQYDYAAPLAEIPKDRTEFTLDVPRGVRYYVLTAYSERGEESPPSNEVNFGIGSPGNLKVIMTIQVEVQK